MRPASGAAWGAVSSTASVMPSSAAARSTRGTSAGAAVATMGVPASRADAHTVADFCGSVSTTTTRSPLSMAATAECTANVVLPLPPFWLKNAMTFIATWWHGVMTLCKYRCWPAWACVFSRESGHGKCRSIMPSASASGRR